LLITTDGIAESMSPEGELFGSEKILEITTKNRVKCTEAVINKLLEESSCFSGKVHQADDMTAVAIKRLQ
ncbi:MAG: SpoIIE family protein phosphatase, partial [Planctomycetaceae bacterium]|nr:SpoIIE family protein phosphatase [Planctomycetaceae bacterium]